MALTQIKASNITDGTVVAAEIGADAIDGTKLADNAINSEHYTDGSVDLAHLSADSVDGTKIVDNAIDSEHYTDGSIDEAHLAADAVNFTTHLKAGTDGELITWDASGNPAAVAVGTSGQVLTSAGTGAPPVFAAASGFTLGTEQATTSGTAITFGSIPSGTKIIYIMFNEVSNNATDDMKVTLGDSGGLETSGYISSGAGVVNSAATSVTNYTVGFAMKVNDAAKILSGHMILTLQDSSAFTWVESHCMKASTTNVMVGGGTKSLSAELTQLSVVLTHSGAYDAGSLNILYM